MQFQVERQVTVTFQQPEAENLLGHLEDDMEGMGTDYESGPRGKTVQMLVEILKRGLHHG